MLVLSRDVGKAIIINDNVEISVLEVQGNSVRFGINAQKIFLFTVRKSIGGSSKTSKVDC